MAEKKNNTFADFEQGVLDVGMSVIEDYRKGYINENKLKAVEALIKMYSAVKPTPTIPVKASSK